MVWKLISKLLGPGPLWGSSQQKLIAAIAEAEQLDKPDAAEHLRGMLELRNKVLFEKSIDAGKK